MIDDNTTSTSIIFIDLKIEEAEEKVVKDLKKKKQKFKC